MNTALNLPPTESHISVAPKLTAQQHIDHMYEILGNKSRTKLTGCIYDKLPREIKTIVLMIARYSHESTTLPKERVDEPLSVFNEVEKKQILDSINDIVESLQGLAHTSIYKFK